MMIDNLIAGGIGAIIGFFSGVIVSALLIVAKDNDDE